MERSKSKNIIFTVVKILVSSAILYVLFTKVDMKKVFSLLKTVDPLLFILSSLCYVVTIFISAVRLRLFIAEDISVKKLFLLNMIGSFFNNMLPGATGGDAVKVFYIFKHTGSGLAAAGAVFMDRYVGFASLMCIGMVALIFAFKKVAGTGVDIFMPAIFVGFFLVSFLVFGFRMGKRFLILNKFYDYYHLYIRKKHVMGYSALYSIAIQLIVILSVYFICIGLKVRIDFMDLVLFLPIVVTLMAVPISISGLGVREGAFVFLLGLAGTPKDVALAISFGWFLSYVAASLLGLVCYFVYKSSKDPQVEVQEQP